MSDNPNSPIHGNDGLKIPSTTASPRGLAAVVARDSSGRGCFREIPQGIQSIRYHSLSAAHSTLPAELAITSAT
ncbi:hypothetical protein B0H34DRAFT_702413, partial [Crassisporium funariophilum]